MDMDILLDILPFVATAYVFYTIGKHVAGFRIMNNLVKNPGDTLNMIKQLKEIVDAEERGMPEEAIEVEVEHVNNMVYAYEKISGKFLAQAQNIHQVMIEAAKRHPGKSFWHPELKKDSQTA
jgi:hypothetical protein